MEVRAEGNNVEAVLAVTNKNLADSGGIYAIQLLEDMIESDRTGIGELVENLWDFARLNMSGLIKAVDAADEMSTSTVKLQLSKKKTDGSWTVKLNNDFINAFMGDMDSEIYSRVQ